MLHNSGPYGPNDVPINMGAPVNMTQMSNPMNLGNNLDNLTKISQQAPQTAAPHYNMPDYSPFSHSTLNMGHTINPFANYHHLSFQTSYGHTNPNLTHDPTPNNVQNNMLPMNLNISSDHGPSSMDCHTFESKRFDVNTTQYRENFSRKLPINIPQIHTKAFHKHLGMESNYGQYNSIQENPYYTQDLSKTTEKTIIDSNRRKSLENTVKLIENILINSTPKDKLRNSQSTESFCRDTLLNDTSVEQPTVNTELQSTLQSSDSPVPDNGKDVQNSHSDLSEKTEGMHDSSINPNNAYIRNFTTQIKDPKMDILDCDVNVSSKIDLKTIGLQDVNTSINEVKPSTKRSSVQNDNSTTIHTTVKTNNTKLSNNKTGKETKSATEIQSKIHCEPLRRSLINNNRILPDKKVQNETDDETESEKEDPITEVNIKKEVIEDDTVKVKVEPLGCSVTDNMPFLRDINATHREDLEADAVIVEENSVAEAREDINKGSNPKTLYECPHCNLLFKHPKRFLIHTKWHSFGLTNVRRQELAREKQLKKSMKKEARIIERLNSKEIKDGAEGDAHPCKDCDKVFAVKSSLKNHRQRYHPTRVRQCKICNASVVGWMALRAHMAAHTAGSGYQCPECPKRFKYAHSLAKHKDTHLICNASVVGRMVLRAHMGGSGYQCSECPKRFKYGQSLAKHKDTHLEKTHGCQQCEKKFGSQTLLKMHMKCHERAARGATFRCTYCGKGFFESYNLQVHERTHRNERPFLCEICKTSFGTNSSLKRHLKVSHSTAKPFPCPTCQRCFVSATTRARHTTRVHGDPASFAHACSVCPRRYKALKELNKHMSKAHPERRE